MHISLFYYETITFYWVLHAKERTMIKLTQEHMYRIWHDNDVYDFYFTIIVSI